MKNYVKDKKYICVKLSDGIQRRLGQWSLLKLCSRWAEWTASRFDRSFRRINEPIFIGYDKVWV